jgi:hypothetical protein
LPYCFQKWLPFNIPNGATDFYQYNFSLGNLGKAQEILFDFANNVRNDLKGAAKIITRLSLLITDDISGQMLYWIGS